MFTKDHNGTLKELEAGATVEDPCRKHGVSHTTDYKRKVKYGGMDVIEAKRLRGLDQFSRGSSPRICLTTPFFIGI